MNGALHMVVVGRRSLVSALAILAALVLGSAGALAEAADRQPPTAPKNLRVTGSAHYSVSLAWDASTDNSGFLTYWILASNGYRMSVPMSRTSATFTDGINAGVTYSFQMYAVDGSGNKSKLSNKVTVSLPRDTNPPSVPDLTVTDVGPTHVSMSWSSTDEGPGIYYWVYRSDWGNFAFFRDTRATSGLVNGLSPNTTYAFQAKARDQLNQMSALSAPIMVTTGPVDPSDTTPPTTPTNLHEFHYPGEREMTVSWTESTDNVDPQDALRYEVYVNGELADLVFGTGSSISYGVFGTNVIEVFAIDAAGNRSEPATIVTEI
jgi:chitodextrinase